MCWEVFGGGRFGWEMGCLIFAAVRLVLPLSENSAGLQPLPRAKVVEQKRLPVALVFVF